VERPATPPPAGSSALWTLVRRVQGALSAVAGRIGASPADSPEARDRKRLQVTVALLVLPASAAWGAIYWIAGERGAALLPWLYTSLSIASLVAFDRRRDVVLLRRVQLALILIIPFTLDVALGGLAHSGAVILWAFLAPLGAVAFGAQAGAWRWFLAYIGLLILATPLGSVVRPGGAGLPEWLVLAFLGLNLGAASLVAFVLLRDFASQREQAQQRADRLLLNILPREVAELLKTSDQAIADQFEEASILFADVVDFTPLSARLTPTQLVDLLNDLFSEFDRLVDQAGLEKIKTIGDCYMVAAGVPEARVDHAQALARLALSMQGVAAARPEPRIQLRIGINSGPVVAGVIGRRKFIYDLWGDAVNTASRMESHGTPGRIQLADATWERIRDEFELVPRGEVEVKGKGRVRTWYLVGERVLTTREAAETAGARSDSRGTADPAVRPA
jgi:guanylate cyclase